MLLVSTLWIDGLANVDSSCHCTSDLVDVYDFVGFHIMYSGTREDMYRSLDLTKKNTLGH
jgi:hypothetical protein